MVVTTASDHLSGKCIPPAHARSNRSAVPRNHFLLLSTSLLVDRVLLYTQLIPNLSKFGDVSIWASSFQDISARSIWESVAADVQKFPAVRPFREVPYNLIRRLNEYVWDFRLMPPSRISIMQHVRSKRLSRRTRALRTPAKLLASLRSERVLEDGLERLLLSYPRSEQATVRLQENPPTVIVSTGPFQFEQPAIFSAAKRLGIPTLAYIPSWDNVSTKNRMVFKYDGYIVWNEKTKYELQEFYPYTREAPIFVIGAPQFDIFHQTRFFQTREEFCTGQGLNPNLPIILYAVGSPNFLKEQYGALEMARRMCAGAIPNAQLLVRPHPIHDNAEMKELFDKFSPMVTLQKTANAGKALTERTQDIIELTEWVNTFRHADVVVNLSSTVTIDAAIFNKPIVNLDFDPQPGQADQQLVKDINHKWTHFSPIAESDGVILVNNFDELEKAIIFALDHPSLHQEERRRIAEYVCGFTDGNCGGRMATAIAGFAATQARSTDL